VVLPNAFLQMRARPDRIAAIAGGEIADHPSSRRSDLERAVFQPGDQAQRSSRTGNSKRAGVGVQLPGAAVTSTMRFDLTAGIVERNTL
jgi:hypothetical protein